MKPGRRGKPELGRHDYDGACAPGQPTWNHNGTFSVGIFQRVKRTDRNQPKTLKRGPVICRVKGLTSEPEMVYQLAERICDVFDRAMNTVNPTQKTYTAERRTPNENLG